jgi:hypothetical protein
LLSRAIICQNCSENIIPGFSTECIDIISLIKINNTDVTIRTFYTTFWSSKVTIIIINVSKVIDILSLSVDDCEVLPPYSKYIGKFTFSVVILGVRKVPPSFAV